MKLLTKSFLWLQVILLGNEATNDGARPIVDLSPQWEVLGPFQIGTREATWAADPLEYYGGFHSLPYNVSHFYDSSLAINGSAAWSIQTGHYLDSSIDATELITYFSFADTDWPFLQSIYGWAALQYQAWARGNIAVRAKKPQTLVFYADNVLEFQIDGKRYFGGDYYAYRRAPLILQLEPGCHQLDIRLIRDVRVMGGVSTPGISVKIRAEVSSTDLAVSEDKLLLPDIVDGKLISHVGSVPVRNEGQEWIDILRFDEACERSFQAALRPGRWSLAPGQTRPVSFDIFEPGLISNVSFVIVYQIRNSPRILYSSMITSMMLTKNFDDPHKLTFLHPSGIVSYVILKCPRPGTGYNPSTNSLPVLLNLHGAGLETDSDQVRHQLDSAGDIPAWTLFPTGGTTWSGDDWHIWGFADVEAAVAAIAIWIKNVAWDGPAVDLERWYVSGHSNGGQGTWFILTHQPDRVVAAAPVSGYSSIQSYVPYAFWKETEPRLASILQSSLLSYRHELLVENFAGIPILQQHGGADDNVPTYHSRRLKQLITESHWQSQYVELAGKGHWFDGIMTTDPLLKFYRNISRFETVPSQLPQNFSIIIPNSGNMGSRGGLEVDQLTSPDQGGKVAVVRDFLTSEWILRTSNIRRFHFKSTAKDSSVPKAVKVDGQVFSLSTVSSASEAYWLVRATDGSWTLSCSKEWLNGNERSGAQRGALDALLRTRGRFLIQSQGLPTLRTAGQIARNLFQYFGADSEIVDSLDMDMCTHGNVISIFRGVNDISWNLPFFALQIVAETGVVIRESNGYKRHYPFVAGLGVIYLQSLPGERSRVVVWGYDESGLRYASRLLPLLTGVGQPDFIVVSNECWWKGTAGVLAMGFFDYAWNVSQASYLT